MKLKATKYLLPTTDGRLHKEISYLISLHENKMNKGKLENRISDLDNRLKQIEHIFITLSESPTIPKVDEPKPIESTQELFKYKTCNKELKGYVYTVIKDTKHYFNQNSIFSYVKEDLALFYSLEDFYNMYNPIDRSQFLFEPIVEPITTPDPITSKTLKTPNEWLKLMSEEERTQWKENRKNADKDKYSINMDKQYDFFDFIAQPFNWLTSPQGHDYWQNISNRYNN